MLWVGWFGFNGGSQLKADGVAGMAIAVTHISAAAAGLVWASLEWFHLRNPSLVGTATGVIAGLATVTPASGHVGPFGGLIIGVAAGAVCYYSVDLVKKRLKVDDSLDVFAVHGVGGMMGTLLVALLATTTMGGSGLSVDSGNIGAQLGVQAIGIAASVAWAAVVTAIILKVTSLVTNGIRVDEEDELLGLDLAAHGERGYDL